MKYFENLENFEGIPRESLVEFYRTRSRLSSKGG